MTTPHKSLLHIDQCSQSHCSATSSSSGRSSASGLTSLQAGDHLTPTTLLFDSNCIVIATGPHCMALGWTTRKTLLPAVPLLLRVCPLLSDCSGIVACLRSCCLAMYVSTEPFPSNGHPCCFHNSAFQQICYSIQYILYKLHNMSR
jgi:hypothetical protein